MVQFRLIFACLFSHTGAASVAPHRGQLIEDDNLFADDADAEVASDSMEEAADELREEEPELTDLESFAEIQEVEQKKTVHTETIDAKSVTDAQHTHTDKEGGGAKQSDSTEMRALPVVKEGAPQKKEGLKVPHKDAKKEVKDAISGVDERGVLAAPQTTIWTGTYVRVDVQSVANGVRNIAIQANGKDLAAKYKKTNLGSILVDETFTGKEHGFIDAVRDALQKSFDSWNANVQSEKTGGDYTIYEVVDSSGSDKGGGKKGGSSGSDKDGGNKGQKGKKGKK